MAPYANLTYDHTNGDIKQKAAAFLRTSWVTRVWNTREDVIQDIFDLVSYDNPANDYFRAVHEQAPSNKCSTITASYDAQLEGTSQHAQPSIPNGVLQLSAGLPPQADLEQHQASHSSLIPATPAVPQSEILPSRTRLSKPSNPSRNIGCAGASKSSTPYYCVVCNDFLSSKGTCCRHIETLHVARKRQKCNGCAAVFDCKAEVKSHLNNCEGGHRGFVTITPPTQKWYASEFTGRLFASQQEYINDLVDSSRRLKGQQPRAQPVRKLYGLLNQPGLRPPLEKASRRLYGRVNAWKHFDWDVSTIEQACEQLQRGLDVYERTDSQALTLHTIDRWLENLLESGQLLADDDSHSGSQPPKGHGCKPPPNTPQPNITPFDPTSLSSMLKPAMRVDATVIGYRSSAAPASWTTSGLDPCHGQAGSQNVPSATPRDKRPLSDNSRLDIPDRRPAHPFPRTVDPAALQASATSSYHDITDLVGQTLPTESHYPYDHSLPTIYNSALSQEYMHQSPGLQHHTRREDQRGPAVLEDHSLDAQDSHHLASSDFEWMDFPLLDLNAPLAGDDQARLDWRFSDWQTANDALSGSGVSDDPRAGARARRRGTTVYRRPDNRSEPFTTGSNGSQH